MIKTGKQATQAVRKIIRKTDWSCRQLTEEINMHLAVGQEISHQTLWRIQSGHTRRPRAYYLPAINAVYEEWCQ